MASESLPSRRGFATAGKITGLIAAVAGVVGAVALIWSSVLPHVVLDGIPHVSGSFEAANAPTILVWALLLLAAALLGGHWARTDRLRNVWLIAIIGTIFAVISLFSVGLYVLPFGLLMVVAALLLTFGRFRGSNPGETGS